MIRNGNEIGLNINRYCNKINYESSYLSEKLIFFRECNLYRNKRPGLFAYTRSIAPIREWEWKYDEVLWESLNGIVLRQCT